jgi:prevent-host-death family protein
MAQIARKEQGVERRIPATEARVHFGELLRELTETGETIVVERSGRAIAAVVPIEAYRRLQGQTSTDWREALRISQAAFRPHVERGLPIDAAELIRQGHEERDERIMHAVLGR